MQSGSQLEKGRWLIAVRNIDEAFSIVLVAKQNVTSSPGAMMSRLIADGGSNKSAIQASAGNAEVGAASPGKTLVEIQSGNLDTCYFYGLIIRTSGQRRCCRSKALADIEGKRLGVQSMGSAGPRSAMRSRKLLASIPTRMSALCQSASATLNYWLVGIVGYDPNAF
jgi:NitT/TauT family transport system substrate-binding protein